MRGQPRKYDSNGNILTVEWKAHVIPPVGITVWSENLAVYQDVYVTSTSHFITL
jgi:hypothetical protein